MFLFHPSDNSSSWFYLLFSFFLCLLWFSVKIDQKTFNFYKQFDLAAYAFINGQMPSVFLFVHLFHAYRLL